MTKENEANQPKLEIIDFHYSLELMEDARLAFDAYDLFQEGLIEHVKSLIEAYEKFDVSEIRRLCHDIKGETSCCGAPQIREAVEQLHSFIKNEDVSKETIEKEFRSLMFSIYRFIAFYPGFRITMR